MSVLKRHLQPIPEFVADVLNEENLMEHYLLRSAYQRNDYLGGINRAKREETKLKGLNQMLDELREGEKYMGMEYKAKMP